MRRDLLRACAGIVATALLLVAGCGTVGPPVPPEYVGIGPILERERLKEEARAKKAKQAGEAERTFSAEEAKKESATTVEGIELPSLHPVGTR